MLLHPLWQALENSGLGQYIASSEIAFPMLETLHVIAIATVVGTIAIMDLRLLGLTSRRWTMTSVSQDTLRLTWIAFGIAVLTGGLLFISKATTYMVNPYFLWKMVLIAAAGLNMAIFHLGAWRTVGGWETGAYIPTATKVSAGLSLGFWIAVVFCGRVIGFTLGIYQPPL